MTANYHIHTQHYMHASGMEREYVEKAIKGGLKILGFLDHTPMPCSGGYVNSVKMRPDQLEDYADTILKLKDEYRDDTEIHIGPEVEYYLKYPKALLKMTGQYPIECSLLAQHYLGNEVNDFYCGVSTDSQKRLARYCGQSKEALETGCSTYFAHPDSVNSTEDRAVYGRWTYQLCHCVNDLDIPLEINFLGIGDKRDYPSSESWSIAGEMGNKVIFGSDVHLPDRVWNPQALSFAEELVNKYHLKLVDQACLRTLKEPQTRD